MENALNIPQALDEIGDSLFIALENVEAPTSLSCYFEIAASHGSTDQFNEIRFDYLTESGWKEMKVLSDDTNQLLHSGIVVLDIPKDIVFAHLHEEDAYWCRCTCKVGSGVFGSIVSIHPQAVLANRVTDEIDSNYDLQLLADSITASKDPIPGVVGITQPFPSFGGFQGESEMESYDRVGARVSNKERVSSLKDYEKEAYLSSPDLFFAKASRKQGAKILLNVMPSKSPESLGRKPVYTLARLLDMKHYLENMKSPFVHLTIANFSWEEVQVKAEVITENIGNRAGIIKRLNDKLKLFFSPWILADLEQYDIRMGAKISDLTALISEDEDVVSVGDIEVYHNGSLCDQDVIINLSESGALCSADVHLITCNSI